MAILYSGGTTDVPIKVIQRGSVTSLWIGLACHSKWSETNKLTGEVWDIMALPALAGRDRIKRVLLLGLGGGTVIHLLKHLMPWVEIVAVELDPTIVMLALRYFRVKKYPDVTVITGDAIEFVSNWSGLDFDLVIDDMFLYDSVEVAAKIGANSLWLKRIIRVLSNPGWIISNFWSKSDLLSTMKRDFQDEDFLRFPSRYMLKIKPNRNWVAVLCGEEISRQELRQRAQEFFPKHRLRFTIQGL